MLLCWCSYSRAVSIVKKILPVLLHAFAIKYNPHTTVIAPPRSHRCFSAFDFTENKARMCTGPKSNGDIDHATGTEEGKR